MIRDIKISVIIPFYKNQKWLLEAVDSVFCQTQKPDEVILINDDSHENIDEFLRKYSEKIIYRKISHGGPAKARNIGMDISTGEYIAFLDSDDLWLPDKLEKQIRLMIDKDSVWSYSSYETFIDGELNNNETIEAINLNNKSFHAFFSSCNIATPTVVIKNDILRENKKLRFNEDMRYGEDTCLWLNISEEYEPLAVNDVLVRVRLRGSNASKIASVQLNARAGIWDIYKNKKDILKVNRIRKGVLFAYKVCYICSKFVLSMNRMHNNKNLTELISKIFYIFPWLVFKMDYQRSLKDI